MLDSYHLCPLLCPSLHEMFPWYLQFSWRHLESFPFYCFPLFLCIVHLQSFLISSSYCLELCIQLDISFPFFLAFCFPFFPQLFVKPPQTTTLPSCISFSLGWVLVTTFCVELLISIHSFSFQALCVSYLIPWIIRHLHCTVKRV